MKLGVILPIFSEDADEALEVARLAGAAGLDGVFCFDHLWPLGQPGRPALAPFPVLAAAAAAGRSLVLGTLVARVGLVPDDVLVAEFDALDALAPGRVLAGIGSGDRLSAPENESYGVAFEPAAARRAALRRCTRRLAERGYPVWIGGGTARTVAIAQEERVAVNLWRATPERVAELAQRGEVTWAGPVPPEPDAAPDGPGSGRALSSLVQRLADAGATWAVFAWPAPLAALSALSALSPRVVPQGALPSGGEGGAQGGR